MILKIEKNQITVDKPTGFFVKTADSFRRTSLKVWKKTVTGASLILSFFFQKMGILLILKHGKKKLEWVVINKIRYPPDTGRKLPITQMSLNTRTQ